MNKGNNTLQFSAEFKELKTKKTADLDLTHRIVLETTNPDVLSLGAIDPQTMLNVEIGIDNG